MKNNKPHWIKNPTKKQVLLICLAWIVGTVLLTSAMTDFFTSSPFYKQNILGLMVILLPAFNTITVFKNYYKNKKAGGVVE